MRDLFLCPYDPPKGVSDVEGCESTGSGQGCKHITDCPVYKAYKQKEMKAWRA